MSRANGFGCGRKFGIYNDFSEREVRDLPSSSRLTTVVVAVYRVRCPDCGVKVERVLCYRGRHRLANDFKFPSAKRKKVVRRAEFFCKGEQKWQMLNELFALNRRVRKDYVLKESLDRL